MDMLALKEALDRADAAFCCDHEEEIARLRGLLERASKALGFYGDHENWMVEPDNWAGEARKFAPCAFTYEDDVSEVPTWDGPTNCSGRAARALKAEIDEALK